MNMHTPPLNFSNPPCEHHAPVPRKSERQIIIDRGEAALRKLDGFIGGPQLTVVRRMLRNSEEALYFTETMERLATVVEAMPRRGESAGDPIVHLHYFSGGFDAWVVERDDPYVFGLCRFAHMPENMEMGDAYPGEWFENRIELDFHFTAVPLSQIREKFRQPR